MAISHHLLCTSVSVAKFPPNVQIRSHLRQGRRTSTHLCVGRHNSARSRGGTFCPTHKTILAEVNGLSPTQRRSQRRPQRRRPEQAAPSERGLGRAAGAWALRSRWAAAPVTTAELHTCVAAQVLKTNEASGTWDTSSAEWHLCRTRGLSSKVPGWPIKAEIKRSVLLITVLLWGFHLASERVFFIITETYKLPKAILPGTTAACCLYERCPNHTHVCDRVDFQLTHDDQEPQTGQWNSKGVQERNHQSSISSKGRPSPIHRHQQAVRPAFPGAASVHGPGKV